MDTQGVFSWIMEADTELTELKAAFERNFLISPQTVFLSQANFPNTNTPEHEPPMKKVLQSVFGKIQKYSSKDAKNHSSQ